MVYLVIPGGLSRGSWWFILRFRMVYLVVPGGLS